MNVRTASVSFVVFVYAIAANVPFWLAGHSMGLLLTGVFNVELLVLGMLSVFLRRWVTVVLLAIAVALDMVRGVSSTYLLSPLEMIRSARYLFEYAPSHSGNVAGVVVCVGVVCLMAALAKDNRATGRERVYVVSTLAAFLVVCGSIDIHKGRTALFHGDSESSALRLTRLPVHSLVMTEVMLQHLNNLRSTRNDAFVPAASKMMVRFENASVAADTNAMVPNVVLILVESWGRSLDADLERSLVQPYLDKSLLQQYTLSEGTVPFYGPTVAGEARELCGSAIGFGLLSASAAELKVCLPERMKEKGYHSLAVHGYSGRMFDRGEWYRRIGFNETWFRDRLQQEGLGVCPGPFPGICDAAAAGWIGDRLEQDIGSPQFIYWVTLNSHLPVPVPNGVKSAPACSDHEITAGDAAMCSWYQLVFNVHRSVSGLALRQTKRPTIFLIVGDHAPPFASMRLKSHFSSRVVPYVLLMPRREEEGDDAETKRSVAVAVHPPANGRRSPLKKETTRSSVAVGGG
jgi:phosphoglycerol transferase MdoB-like AlkP superfamily enzyme